VEQFNTRDALIRGLQEDLAREYKAIIQYVIYSQKLDGPQYMSIAAELETHAHQELDHALAIAKQLDYFNEYPVNAPKPVPVSEENEDMLWFDLKAEDETVRNYRDRVRQAQDLGEFALAEVLQDIIRQEQDHQIDLATALGVPPIESQRAGQGPSEQEIEAKTSAAS
jgi:bacterioferritin